MNKDKPKIDFSQISKYQMEALGCTLLKSCTEFYSALKNVEKYKQWKEERNKNEGEDA